MVKNTHFSKQAFLSHLVGAASPSRQSELGSTRDAQTVLWSYTDDVMQKDTTGC